MPWQIPLFLSVLIGYIIAPILIKMIARAPSRPRSLSWQYFFCGVLASAAALLNGADLADQRLLIVAGIGAVNAFACYCHWRAVDISMTRTALFTQGDDIIAMLLGYLILGEGKLLNSELAIGVALAVGAVLFYSLSKKQTVNSASQINGWEIFGKWVLCYSVIWGGAIFSMRFFALKGLNLTSYTAAWYSGSFLGALMTLRFSSKKESGEPLKARAVISILPLSVSIWTSLMLYYWSVSLAPITVVQPICQVSGVVFPALIGVFVFKEVETLNIKSKMAMAIGLVGALIITFSFGH